MPNALTRENLVKACGMALIFGGLTSFPFFMGAGFFGLYLRFRDSLGRIERFAMLAGVVYQFAFAVVIFLVIPLQYSPEEAAALPGFDVFSRFSALFPFLCLSVFGVTVFRRRLMEAWSFLPGSVGILWALFLLMERFGREPGGILNYLAVFITAYTFIGLVVMGVLLIRGAGDDDTDAADGQGG